MRAFRIPLSILAVLALGAWYWLRVPWSPTQTLAPVSLVAFRLQAANPEAGLALAAAAREWPGVTATTYNPSSDLLALSFTAATSEPDLQRRMETLLPRPVVKARFPAATGPQCPIPHGLLAQIPDVLLWTGLLAGLLSLFAWRLPRRALPATLSM
ncbi:MAG: hypothetical protein IT260_10455 [Saprospiraceae bacterium]|nr:hypothetical protein [Saprospiraceae bacterium]